MPQNTLFFKIGLFLLFVVACTSPKGEAPLAPAAKFEPLAKSKVKGMALTAPPAEPTQPGQCLQHLQGLGVNWLSVHPFGFFRKNQPDIRYNTDFQWWGERPEGVIGCAQQAKKHQLKVLLKPQLWSHSQWIGELTFAKEDTASLLAWQQNYRDFILPMARLADSLQVDMFCIGTEVELLAQQAAPFWRQLIADVRKIYKGPLIYAANWDSYAKIEFWDELDFIGIDAYFPLLDASTPKVKDLVKAWQKDYKAIKALQQKYKKPVIFTEFGYLSVDGCAHKTWELEKNRNGLNVNEQAQANAVEALLQVFGKEDWWKGGFQWKWYFESAPRHFDGNPAKDYYPKGKKVEEILKKYYVGS